MMIVISFKKLLNEYIFYLAFNIYKALVSTGIRSIVKLKSGIKCQTCCLIGMLLGEISRCYSLSF